MTVKTTVRIKKSNRILTVAEGRLKAMLAQGYDQIDEKGKIVKRATGGKNYTAGDVNKLIAENEKLKENASPTNDGQTAQLEKELTDAKKEVAKLKGENTRLKKEAEKKG